VFTGQESVQVGGVRPQMWTGAVLRLRHFITPYAAG
jgi:hypothetical protein